MYPNALSGARAGLVVLVFTLIFSFVSAAPIPTSASQSGLSSSVRSTSNQDLIFHGDTGKILQVPDGPISTVSVTARAFTVKVRCCLSSDLATYPGLNLHTGRTLPLNLTIT